VEVRGIEDEALHVRVEVGGDARENARRLLRPVAVLVKMVIDGFPPRIGRALHLGRQRLDRESLSDLREPLGLPDRGFHVGERALETAER
jgi:hypothetical protein